MRSLIYTFQLACTQGLITFLFIPDKNRPLSVISIFVCCLTKVISINLSSLIWDPFFFFLFETELSFGHLKNLDIVWIFGHILCRVLMNFCHGEWSILDPCGKLVRKLYVTFYILYLIYFSQWFNKYKLIEKTTEV